MSDCCSVENPHDHIRMDEKSHWYRATSEGMVFNAPEIPAESMLYRLRNGVLRRIRKDVEQ